MTNPAFFITGGGSGMGRAAALHFARQGARIALFDAADAGLKQVQDQLRSEGLECLTFKGDVRSRAELDSAIAQTHAAFGRLDRLVCAAGILRSGRLAELSEDVWDLVMDINVKGVLLTCQAAMPYLLGSVDASGRGKIVVISSASAHNPKVGMGAYAVSKLALINLVRVLAAEHAGQGINVNAIAPGTISTPMITNHLAAGADSSGFKLYGTAPVGRMGEPEDVVNIIDFLCSSKADFVTGSFYGVDGGSVATFPV